MTQKKELEIQKGNIPGREKDKALSQNLDWPPEVKMVTIAEYVFKQRKRESRFLCKKQFAGKDIGTYILTSKY